MSVLSYLKKPSRVGILVGLICAGVSWGAASTQWLPFRGLEEWLHDGAFSLRGTRTTRARVVLIGLDDRSLNALPKPLAQISPEIAQVVSFAKGQGATAIGIDIVIPANLGALPELQEDGAGDATTLGRAIKDAGNVVLPDFGSDDGWLPVLPQWRLKHFLDPGPNDSGVVNNTEDEDHFVRRQQLLIRDGKIARRHFALALFAQAQHIQNVEWDDTRRKLLLDGETVPLDDEQKLRINFVGPPGTIPIVPFGDVLDKARAKTPMPELAGAIVIIGVTARSHQDIHATPFANNFARSLYSTSSGLMTGPEVHANIIATLQDRAYLVSPPWFVTLGILLLAGGLLGRVYARLNLAWGLLVAVGVHFGWKYFAYFALTWIHWRLDIVGMLILGGLVYAATFMQRWWAIRKTLGIAKSKSVARLLEEDPEQLEQRGGAERIATVLFADIRNFTDFSESHSAREVVDLLNAYFTALVPVIEAHGGTLTTYMGDGMMVIFGAPTPWPDHATRGVRAAVAMVEKVRALKETWADLGMKDLRIGIGIHTGRVVVGMVGSPTRLDYTAIGDTVNTAARIETQNKDFKTEILISSDTYRDVPAKDRAALGCQETGQLAEVKGKRQQLTLHAVSAPVN